MKKSVIIFMMMCSVIMYSQKSKNGTIFKDHPAIVVVEEMQKAFVAGDADKVATYLAEDFKAYNGVSTNKEAKGADKKAFLNRVNFWKDNVDYLTIRRTNGAYPDALEYKDDEDGVWVQTWDHMTGVHKKTGVKIDMPYHRLYAVNKDNKIKTAITYTNERTYNEIGQSFVERTNGTLYNHHEYINTVRYMIATIEHGDLDKTFSFFTEDARFRNLDTPRGEFISVEEERAAIEEFIKTWDIESIDIRGYPDYLHYELGNAKVVQSWWDLRLKRKSDGKKEVVPVMLIHNFNDDGKITSENGYYTLSNLGK